MIINCTAELPEFIGSVTKAKPDCYDLSNLSKLNLTRMSGIQNVKEGVSKTWSLKIAQ